MSIAYHELITLAVVDIILKLSTGFQLQTIKKEENCKKRTRSICFSKSHTKQLDRKKLRDYRYYTGSNVQASDFESTTEFIINYIKGEFNYGNNITEHLSNSKNETTENWYPTLEINTGTDIMVNIIQTRQFEPKTN